MESPRLHHIAALLLDDRQGVSALGTRSAKKRVGVIESAVRMGVATLRVCNAVCVLRNRADPRTGEFMRGGLRWLYRPFQVLCVLVAVLLTAAFSLQSGFAGHSGGRPVRDKPNLGSVGERLNANTIAVVSDNPKPASRQIASGRGGPVMGLTDPAMLA